MPDIWGPLIDRAEKEKLVLLTTVVKKYLSSNIYSSYEKSRSTSCNEEEKVNKLKR